MPSDQFGGSSSCESSVRSLASREAGKNAITAQVAMLAPSGAAVLEYDRRHLSLYAGLLDAETAGDSWQQATVSLMGVDPAEVGAEACWQSHLNRARWIVGEGLGTAIAAFNVRPNKPL